MENKNKRPSYVAPAPKRTTAPLVKLEPDEDVRINPDSLTLDKEEKIPVTAAAVSEPAAPARKPRPTYSWERESAALESATLPGSAKSGSKAGKSKPVARTTSSASSASPVLPASLKPAPPVDVLGDSAFFAEEPDETKRLPDYPGGKNASQVTMQIDSLRKPPRSPVANDAGTETMVLPSVGTGGTAPRQGGSPRHSGSLRQGSSRGTAGTAARSTPKKPAAKPEPQKQKEAILKRMKRQQEHIRTFSHILVSLLLIAVILVSSIFLSQYIVRAFLDYTGIAVNEFDVTIELPPNAATEEIARILSEYGIIDMPELFAYYSRVSDKDGKYLAGSFDLNSTMSYSQIIHVLQNRSRSNQTVRVKIIEGMTAREIGELLEENEVCRAADFEKFYRDRMDEFSFERRLEYNPDKFNQMEGYLFPDTYEFYIIEGLADDPNVDTTRYARTVAMTMMRQFNSQITREMYRRMADKGFTLDEFVTLASMVQWEAAEQDDMLNVASVFINRLNSPETFPLLQSDVTKKYATNNIAPYLPGNPSLNSIIGLYDTYLSPGLPPGPICNPGMTAMLAVLDAPQTNYWYFCADIETGEVFFARTLAEHEQNEIRAGIR